MPITHLSIEYNEDKNYSVHNMSSRPPQRTRRGGKGSMQLSV